MGDELYAAAGGRRAGCVQLHHQDVIAYGYVIRELTGAWPADDRSCRRPEESTVGEGEVSTWSVCARLRPDPRTKAAADVGVRRDERAQVDEHCRLRG